MIVTLPPPPRLALPLMTGAQLRVQAGMRVTAGSLLADGDNVAEVRAPVSGDVVGISRRLLAATGKAAVCIVLEVLGESPPPSLPPMAGGDLPTLLKRTGIIGLGGGAFPAWRKWRPQLRLFVANAVESDPLVGCDAALLADNASAAFTAALRVGRAFADDAVLAVAAGDAAAMLSSHSAVREVPSDYALGGEHLLVRHISGWDIPPARPLADYGVVCFNIGTVLAMAAALEDGVIMCGRVLTVRCGDTVTNIRVPFGATVGDIRRFLRLPTEATAVGGERRTTAGDDAVIDAACNFLDFAPRRAAAALPCVRCNACAPVCPVHLSPMRLYHAATDEDWDDMAAKQLDDCLECRRCDDVCPSRIPLTAVFIHAKDVLAHNRRQRGRQDYWRDRHVRHQQRLQKPVKRLSARDILDNLGGGV